MAKVLTMTRVLIESTDGGESKRLRCQYKVEDSEDSSLCKSGTHVHDEPDFTKTVDDLFTECVAGIKEAEGIS